MDRSNLETMLGEEQNRPDLSEALAETVIFIMNAPIAAGIIDKSQAIAMLEDVIYYYQQNNFASIHEVETPSREIKNYNKK